MAQIPLTGRTQVDNRDLYGYTTPRPDPAAKPTDPYIQPGLSANTMGLLNAVRSMNEVAPTVGAAWVGKQQEEVKRGSLERMKQKDNPNATLDKTVLKNQAAIRGWEIADGKITAATMYNNELSAYHDQHKDVDTPEEYLQGIADISKRYLQGASDDWNKGFLPTAMEMDEKYLALYQEELNKTYQTKQTNAMINGMSVDVDSILNKSLAIALGANPLTFDMNAFLKDPVQYDKIANDKTLQAQLSEALKSTLHTLLTTNQTNLGEYKTKDEISEALIDVIGQRARMLGLPEALDFTNVKDKDKIALFDTKFVEKIRIYREGAEATRARLSDAHGTQSKKDREESQRILQNGFEVQYNNVLAIKSIPERVLAATKMEAEIEQDPSRFDTGWLSSMLGRVKNAEGVVFALADNNAVIANLEYKRSHHMLTDADIQGNISNLTDNSYIRYNSALEQQNERSRILSESGRKNQSADEAINRVVSFVTKTYTYDPLQLDRFNGRGTEIQVLFAAGIEDWRKDHNGAEPSFHQWYKDIAIPTMQMLEKNYGKLAEEDTALMQKLGLQDVKGENGTSTTPNPTTKQNAAPPATNEKSPFEDDEETYKKVNELFKSGHTRKTLTEGMKTTYGLKDNEIAHIFTNYGLQYVTDSLETGRKQSVKAQKKGQKYDENTLVQGVVDRLTYLGYKENEIEFYLEKGIGQYSGAPFDYQVWKKNQKKPKK